MSGATEAPRDRLEGEDTAARRELHAAIEQLRRQNEELAAENIRLRDASEEQERHLASFPLLNPNPVLEVDRGGRTLFCNPAARAVLKSLGLEAEFPGPFLPSDLAAAVVRPHGGLGGNDCHEVTLQGRTFGEHLYPVPGTDAVRVYAFEITEKARAERELAANLQRLNAHMDNSPVAVVEFDPQFRVIRWSKEAERAFGWRAEEILGRRIEELPWVPEESVDVFRRESRAFLSGEMTRNVHVNRNLRRDGSARHCEWYCSAIFDAAGELASVLSIVLDVTDRIAAERALHESKAQVEQNLADIASVNAELEAFVYSVSHDLREPLRAFSGFAQLLLARHAGRLGAQGADYLRRIERGAAKMSRLIEDLLDLSRVSRQRLDRAEVDLSAIAAATVAELRESSPARTVDVEIAPGVTAVADRGLVEIALSNLLANAWKFTSQTAAARIRFGSTVLGCQRTFFVEDNGVGFDPAHASQLFQPFCRLHPGSEYPGTGIGLALVERVVNRHGGRVWAEGRPGGGATLLFTLGDGR